MALFTGNSTLGDRLFGSFGLYLARLPHARENFPSPSPLLRIETSQSVSLPLPYKLALLQGSSGSEPQASKSEFNGFGGFIGSVFDDAILEMPKGS